MSLKSLTAAVALAALAAPALAQTPEAQLTTPPPASEAEAAPAAQGQQAAPAGPTEAQRQAAQQAVQQYFALYGLNAYAERCGAFPPAEGVFLDAQLQLMDQQFTQMGADLSQQKAAISEEVAKAECGEAKYADARANLIEQLAAPINVLVLSFDKVDPSCRATFLEADEAAFDALVERRRAGYEGELPQQVQQGVTQTSEAISQACANSNEEQIAQLRQGLEVQAIRAALAE